MDRLISEQDVIDTIYESHNNFKNEFDQGFFVDKIRALPSVIQQPKTGHWIRYGKLYQCSECKELSCCQGKFCNECGAMLVNLQESEDKKCENDI